MGAMMTVGELEARLFEAFPREDAESWDQPGLAVGDRDTHVERIAFSLDMSTQAVLEAHKRGCKTLVTHHPPFIKAGPTEFGPAVQRETNGPGRMVYEAARRGVNVIAMHTNADRAVATRMAFARMLDSLCTGNFEHLTNPARSVQGTGFGALLEPDWDGPHTLAQLARRCAAAFGGAPRVWGSPKREVARIAVLNGSWGEPELYGTCVREGIDCVVVGETKYHWCVDAQPHLAVLELGHDVSELPLVDVLMGAVARFGVDEADLVKLDCARAGWWVPGMEGMRT